MSDFIFVIGESTTYKNRLTPIAISRNSVARIHPEWAVESNGQRWQCTPNFKDGKVVYFTLVDHHNQRYRTTLEVVQSLVTPEDFALLTGTEPPPEDDRRFGFDVKKDPKDKP